MTDYRVIWEIDIEAGSPLEALRKAREIQQDKDNIADVFYVKDKKTGKSIIMDCAGNDYPACNTDYYINLLNGNKLCLPQ